MSLDLKNRILRAIEHNGPMRVDEYIALCMAEEQQGYYQNATPFGAAGDFITAPEVHQIFGELIGVWLVTQWQALGNPLHFNLIELGPGRGTLMADCLRVIKAQPSMAAACSVTMVENSQMLVNTQQQTLAEFGFDITWQNDITQLPDGPTLIIANEFLDVLPIRQFQKQDGAWVERCIGTTNENGLQFVAGAGGIDAELLPNNHEEEPDGAVFEASPAREAALGSLTDHLVKNGGAALFIDYGHAKTGFGETLQAVSAHQYVDVLTSPGQADISSHVDFDSLQRIVTEHGGFAKPIITQSDFLLAMGLRERAGQLGAGKSQQTQEALQQAVLRLAHPDQMGTLFKCFCITGSHMMVHPFDANHG